MLFSDFAGPAIVRDQQRSSSLLAVKNIGPRGVARIIDFGQVESAKLSMDMKQSMRLPVQDAADGIVVINTVPKIADMFGIPYE